MFTFDKNKFYMTESKKSETAIISLRVTPKLKDDLKKKHGRKLAQKVIPFLIKISK